MSFVDFYNGLDTTSLVMLWSAIFAFLFLIVLSLNMYKKNKKLINVIEELKKTLNDSVKSELDKKESVLEKEENVTEEKKVVNEEVKNNDQVNIEVFESEKMDKVEEGPYTKNVLRQNTARYQTSPISIKKDTNIEQKVEKVVEEEKQENLTFAEEISRKMEQELKPQTIELTDYEKQQEEEAIISYQELLNSNKDRLYNITEEEETVDFINELKSFRSSL